MTGYYRELKVRDLTKVEEALAKARSLVLRDGIDYMVVTSEHEFLVETGCSGADLYKRYMEEVENG